MLSYSQILENVREAAQAARKRGLQPLSIRGFDPEQPRDFIRRIPFLGDYIPANWIHPEELEDLFVDSTGFGSPNEPALTVNEFIKRLNSFHLATDHFGFGIIEAGEFQVYIRVYKYLGNLTARERKLLAVGL